MKTILKIRDICKEHHSCYDNCPFHVDNECVIGIPPANWSTKDLYLIAKVLKGDEDEEQTPDPLAQSLVNFCRKTVNEYEKEHEDRNDD